MMTCGVVRKEGTLVATDNDQPESTDQERRSFLQRLLQAALSIGALGALGGIAAFVFPPERREFRPGPERVHVGSAADFELGQGRQVQFQGKPIWVLRLPGGFAAISAICTHKGCIVDWDVQQRLLACPCHRGLYDTDGNVVQGLPHEPLPHFRVDVVRGEVYVAEQMEA